MHEKGGIERNPPSRREKKNPRIGGSGGRTEKPQFEWSCFELGMFPFSTLSKYLLFLFPIFVSLFRLPAFHGIQVYKNFRPEEQEKKRIAKLMFLLIPLKALSWCICLSFLFLGNVHCWSSI